MATRNRLTVWQLVCDCKLNVQGARSLSVAVAKLKPMELTEKIKLANENLRKQQQQQKKQDDLKQKKC